MTYARARLLVGITAVGTWVVLAGVFLATGTAGRLPGPDAPFATQAAVLAIALAVYVLVSLPFDVMGGFVLPRRYGRPTPSPARYAALWARGAAVQAALMAGSAALVIWADHAGGVPAALGTVAVIALVIGVARYPLARLVAPLGRRRPLAGQTSTDVVQSLDPGFTGGIVGLRGRNVIPDAWVEALGADLPIEIERRRACAGWAYGAGIALAAIWTVGGVAVALTLPGGGADGTGPMLATGAWFTLWSFLGLLILPSVSRPAVFAADAAAAKSWPIEDCAHVIRVLDARQDDEPVRASAIETIFHPIPGAEHRIARLQAPRRVLRPWHVARLALPMSWACLGLLGRAVHCNAGRPELWVMLPAD